jgi:magnesium transporter
MKMAGNRFNLLSGLSKSPPEPPSPLTRPQPQASGSSAQQQQQQQPQAPKQRPGKKRRNHRGGKKKRRKSFAILDDDENHTDNETTGAGLYQIPAANISETSLESESLLDHRFVACRP